MSQAWSCNVSSMRCAQMLLFTRCFRVAVVLPVYMFHQIAKMSAVLSFKSSHSSDTVSCVELMQFSDVMSHKVAVAVVYFPKFGKMSAGLSSKRCRTHSSQSVSRCFKHVVRRAVAGCCWWCFTVCFCHQIWKVDFGCVEATQLMTEHTQNSRPLES